LLRVVKFTTKYGFTIPPDVKAAIRRNVDKLWNAPPSALSNLLINTVLVEPYGKKALYQMKDLGILDVIAEMIRKVPPFRDTLQRWVNNQRVQLMFDLMDVGLPLNIPMRFLTPDQQTRMRSLALKLDDPEGFLDILHQPGKAWQDKDFFLTLAREREVGPKQLGLLGRQVMDAAREVLLATPSLAHDPIGFQRAIRGVL
jgi:tRNA nucleotidyltransferase/poly(A) polymerase